MDTGTFVDGVHVVGEQSVATVLGDEAERNENGQSPAVTLGAEEVGVAAGTGSFPLHTHGLSNLPELELDRGIVRVTGTVVGSKHVESLLFAILGEQESGGLGDPVDEGQLDQRGDDLNKGDGSPRPVALDRCGTPTDARDDQGARVPETVVHGGDGPTMLRMADLSKQEGGCHLSETVSKSEQETSSEVHCRGLATGWPVLFLQDQDKNSLP